jgi:general secretion pathway protein K
MTRHDENRDRITSSKAGIYFAGVTKWVATTQNGRFSRHGADSRSTIRTEKRDHSAEHGFALVAMLCAAAILAAIVASVLATSRTEVLLARHRQEIAELGATAGGALNIAILRLLDPSPSVQPPVDATPFTVAFAGHELRLTVRDEAGKIDLNMVQPDLLLRLLTSAGLDLMAAQTLADRILDWRVPGLGERLNGAKAPEYRAAGYAYGPRNGPFESVEELKLVMGMTAELFDAIASALTVYSQTPWVDPTIAAPEVLRRLPGIDDGAVATLLQARAAGSAKPLVMLGHAFTITAEADGLDALRVKHSAVVRPTGHQNAPIWVYRWG